MSKIEDSFSIYDEIITQIKTFRFASQEGLTIREIASFYECGVEAIRTVIKRNSNTLFDNIKTLRGSELATFKKNHPNVNLKGLNSLSILNKKQIIEIGLLLCNNTVAGKMQALVIENETYFNLFKHVLTFFQPLKKQRTLAHYLKLTFNSLLKIETEIPIGSYRVDILINDNLIVECDEFGHINYSAEDEVIREKYLAEKGYRVLRYNPDTERHDTDLFKLINSIFKEVVQVA